MDREHVESHLAQVAERGVSRAEVVQGQRQPPGLGLAEDRPGGLGVALEDPLGDPQVETLGLGAALLQHLAHPGHEVGLGHLAARDVDLDAERRTVGEGLLPRARLAGHLLEHPAPDGDDQPGVLERRHELLGSQEPSGGLGPAEQGLDPDEALGPERDDGLVVEAELAVVEGLAHPPAGGRGADLVAHGPVERDETADAELPGLVQGGVGVLEHLVGPRAALLGDGHAHRRREPDPVLTDLQRLLDRLEGPAGDALGGHGRRHVRAEQHELVASVADGTVLGPEGLHQPGGDGDHHLVPERGPVGGVDLLEALEVDEDHGDPAVLAAGLLEHLVEAVAEEPAVGQPGEDVVVGEAEEAGPRRPGIDVATPGEDAGPDRDDHPEHQQARDVPAVERLGPVPRPPLGMGGEQDEGHDHAGGHDPGQVPPGARVQAERVGSEPRLFLLAIDDSVHLRPTFPLISPFPSAEDAEG